MEGIVERFGLDKHIAKGLSASFTDALNMPISINNWTIHNAQLNKPQSYMSWNVEALSGSGVDQLVYKATKEQLQKIVKRLFEARIYSQTRTINVYQQCVDAIWYTCLASNKAVIKTPENDLDAHTAQPLYVPVVEHFRSLVSILSSPVQAFVFSRQGKLGLWAVHKDEGLDIQIRLAEIYNTLRKEFPTVDIDFMYYSEREFEQVELPFGTNRIELIGNDNA